MELEEILSEDSDKTLKKGFINVREVLLFESEQTSGVEKEGFNMYNCKMIQNKLDGLLNAGADVVEIDLRKLSYIDSSAVGVCVKMQQELTKKGGEIIVLVEKDDSVDKVLKITKLDEMMNVTYPE